MLTTPFQSSFSILMAVYHKDCPKLFGEAIGSIFNSTITPSKVVIVCDGPLNLDLEDILKSVSAHYGSLIKIVRLLTNSGLAAALNEGLKHIDTVWVARADADDINRPNRFNVLDRLIKQNPTSVLVGGAIQERTADGKNLKIRCPPSSYADISKYARIRNPFNHMTTAFKTAVVKELHGYPNVHLREDYGLWIKILSAGHMCVNTPEVLVDVTAGLGMYKRRGGLKNAKAEIQLQGLLVSNKMKSPMRGVLDGLLRSIIFLGPVGLRKTIYNFFLRS
jgi:glycosyltransferase involved in cell wall biosynthesis